MKIVLFMSQTLISRKRREMMAYKVIQDPFKHDNRLEWLIEKLKDEEYMDGLIKRMKAEGAFSDLD